MKKSLWKVITTIFLVILVFQSGKLSATHLRAGEIIVRRVNCQSLTFEITVLVYTDIASGVTFGDGDLLLGDGSDPDNDGKKGFRIPDVSHTPRPDLGPDVGTAQYTFTHTYGAPGRYIISYYEQNRNAGIINMDNSIGTTFFIEAEIIVDPFLGCNNSPVMLIPPIDKGCPGVAFFHNPGAYDPDGDSLSYEIIIPKKAAGTNVDNYRDPVSTEFYNVLPYANEDGTGDPEFSIDPITGELKWDAPGDVSAGGVREYNVAFKIKEWRKINGQWFPIGYVVRDMQVIIEDCDNDRPELIIPKDTCVIAGTTLDEVITGFDINYDDVKIEAFSELFFIGGERATYTPNDGSLQSTEPPNTASVRFLWETDCSHVRDQPYQVVFKITDYPDNGPKLVSFEAWNIRVVAPEPTWSSASLDFSTKSVNLEWDPYPCGNAESIQIWRRVDSYNYVPGHCDTGMPDNIGYELIDEVNPVSTTYSDNNNGLGLDPGAKYCYRLVAVFSLPSGGESIMSEEICIEPVEADAPIITHVTVDVTDPTNGEITISWKPPFDLDVNNFGTDYVYEIQRSEGLTPTTFTIAGTTQDTTFTDIGLNTENRPYNYQIVLYSNDASLVDPDVPIDTSAVASSVWLQSSASANEIVLYWIGVVPWSNTSQNFPWHYIYRGEEGDLETELTLIDSVNVNIGGFTYLDIGKYNNTPLDETKVYCYYVVTQGTYGNPSVEEPLLNKSQMMCTQPNDDLAPCPPKLSAEIIDCEEFIRDYSCDFTDFSNTIYWENDFGGDCQDDIMYYEIHIAATTESDFQYYTQTVDTFFIDKNLPSYARCYKIRAVDRSGNLSEFSNRVCLDNCPNYVLPNVFTPGEIDGCNDFFRAFGDTQNECDTREQEEILQTCARFVLSVKFKVFNRWGRPVYNYQSGGENTIYIDWDGRDNNGKELSAGIYYYLAEVEFDVVNPKESVKEYKGWVKIFR